MKTVIDISLLACCLAIAVQDFRERLISVCLLVLLAWLLAALFFLFTPAVDHFYLLLSNLLFVSAQLLLLYFYFACLRPSGRNFFADLLGWGDVVMLLCMCLAFPLPQLVVYILVSCLCGIFFLLLHPKKNRLVTAPLAGIMALLYALNTAAVYCTGTGLFERIDI